jgi:hypothetical protein
MTKTKKPKIPVNQLEAEAMTFHDSSPDVWGWVCKFTRRARLAGHKRLGIGLIWERIRWEVRVETKDLKFKMPNNHRAYYARWWNDNHPDLDPPFFRTRALRSLHRVPVDRYGLVFDDEPVE